MKIFNFCLGCAIVGLPIATVSPAKAFGFISDITGADMVGIEVTVSFENGSSEMGIWAATGVDSGAASGTGWDLSIAGNTNFGAWIFSYTGTKTISSLLIDTLPGNTIFDTILLPELTPTTGIGNRFGSFSGASPTEENYSGTVLGALEDVKTSLELVWENGFNDPVLAFVADTDGIEGFNPDPEPVPEPTATLGILGSLALGTVSLRKKK
ncbi:MAG: PEP-CTERM sorting domain-containing protein [Cyanobacteria bacterium SBLK]|nr:PEP-CTERM sorting domain-containing protein [Cyanobacteria bacterium SBLK]